MNEPTLGRAVALSAHFGVAIETSQVERFTKALNQMANHAYAQGVRDAMNQPKQENKNHE